MAWTYTDLLAAIASTVNRPDRVAEMPTWIYLAEQELSTVLHRREMAQRATTTTVQGQASYELPDDFGEAMAMHLNVEPKRVLDPTDWDRIALLYRQPGRPQAWCINQNEFLLGPTPDAAYEIELYYYTVLPNLSGAVPTNWLLTSYPRVYLYGALCEAAYSSVDEPRAGKWTDAYQKALQALIKDQIRDRGLGGGPLLRTEFPLTSRGFNVTTGDY